MHPFEGAAASLAAADATLTSGKQRAAVAGRGRTAWQMPTSNAWSPRHEQTSTLKYKDGEKKIIVPPGIPSRAAFCAAGLEMTQ
jgi:hypothetical protein